VHSIAPMLHLRIVRFSLQEVVTTET
jgi:hypothetical protein